MNILSGVHYISDVCKPGNNKCSRSAVCTPVGATYKCECKAGFSGDGFTCRGIQKSNLIVVFITGNSIPYRFDDFISPVLPIFVDQRMNSI